MVAKKNKCRDTNYSSHGEARSDIPKLKERYKRAFKVYKCKNCNYFHITTTGRNMKAKRDRNIYRKYQLPIEIWEGEGGYTPGTDD